MSMADSNQSEDPTLERHFKGHQGEVTALAFNPTMKQIASSSLDSTLMVWNFRKTTRAFRFKGHTEAVYDVCFSPSGNLIASASKDRTVRLWVPTLQGGTGEIKAHAASVRSVDFSPDGTQLLTASDDKSVKIWSAARKKFISSFTGHSNWVRCARFSPEGNTIASCSDDKTIKLCDQRSGQCVHNFPETKGFAINLAFHPSGICIGTAMSNSIIKIYDIRVFKLLQHYASHQKQVNKIAFHPTGNFLLSASDDEDLKIIDILEGRPIYTLQGHKEGTGIKAVTFSENGEFFASGGADQQILVWRTNCDREKLLVDYPQRPSGKIRESDLDLDAPVRFQVDARSAVKGCRDPDIDVTNVESDLGVENEYPMLRRQGGGGDEKGALRETRNRDESDETLRAVVESLAKQVDILTKSVETLVLVQKERDDVMKEIRDKLLTPY